MSQSKPGRVVAVSQRVDDFPDRDEQRDAVDQRLLVWILEAGFVPVPVPNIFSRGLEPYGPSRTLALAQWLQMVRPKALLLSGGNDIGEFPERDTTELCLLDWAEECVVPVLGICRGMQMMAVRAGVKLKQKEGHVKTRHFLNVPMERDSWPENVNSYHDWCLPVCPDGFEVKAHSEDGTIEAIRHKKLPWEGWMWHPERENPFSKFDTSRAQRLFNGK